MKLKNTFSIGKKFGNKTPVGVKLPVIDYLVMIGSSSTAHTYTSNPILGEQLNPSRAAFCAEGIDVPIISAGVSGATIADTKDSIASIIANLGPIPSGKK